MPNPNNAITGQSSIHRARQKKQREAGEQIQTFPNWMKNWSASQGESYLESVDFSDPDAIKTTFQRIWQMCVMLRDYAGLFQESDK